MNSGTEVICARCGTCCVAPDISTLNKPPGVPCPHLTEDHLCGIYEDRPSVCRDYKPDEVCLRIQAPTLSERVVRYQDLFGLEGENSR